jgi:hypothetical protein
MKVRGPKVKTGTDCQKGGGDTTDRTPRAAGYVMVTSIRALVPGNNMSLPSKSDAIRVSQPSQCTLSTFWLQGSRFFFYFFFSFSEKVEMFM